MGRELGRSEEIDRDEPAGVIIYISMATTQGNSLCSYLYLKLAKMPCFSLYLLYFFFYKMGGSQNRVCRGWG
jgi:hypothetical protein